MIERSGAGSVPLTKGSGSGSKRPKNIHILRIRIRNTDLKTACIGKIQAVYYSVKFLSLFLGLKKDFKLFGMRGI
jgi:hypothetical protein